MPGVVLDEGTELDPVVTLLVLLEPGLVIVEVKVDVDPLDDGVGVIVVVLVVPGWLDVLTLDSLLEVV